jgi:chromosomal replication initiation ATPase DnaA
VQSKARKRQDTKRSLYRELKLAFDCRFTPEGKGQEEEAIKICDGMIDILSVCFAVPGREIRQIGRNVTSIARVRQIGMYICHVVIGMTMQDVAIGFMRDRSTVVHACHLIEDMRDDVDFDAIICTIERIAQAAFGAYTER